MVQKRLKNSEDRHILPSGTVTRVLAKNLMQGDTMVLAGSTTGTIQSVCTVLHKNGTVTTTFIVRNSKRKTFNRTVSGYTRIWIVEYPNTRFARRALSRIENEDRPHYIVK